MRLQYVLISESNLHLPCRQQLIRENFTDTTFTRRFEGFILADGEKKITVEPETRKFHTGLQHFSTHHSTLDTHALNHALLVQSFVSRPAFLTFSIFRCTKCGNLSSCQRRSHSRQHHPRQTAPRPHHNLLRLQSSPSTLPERRHPCPDRWLNRPDRSHDQGLPRPHRRSQHGQPGIHQRMGAQQDCQGR